MTAVALPQPGSPVDTGLDAFGYQQQLHRSIGTYASFAAGFSFVSILTTVFQLFGFGFSFAGPVFFWTWPAVFLGQLMVAFCFAELAARYPISGAIYQWSRRLGGHAVGWFAGWTMVIAQIVTIAAAAIAMQAVLPAIWDGFQLVGGDPAISTVTGATNAIVLGLIVLTVTTIINSVAVKVMAVINAVGVTCELVGVVLLIVAFFLSAERGPGIVLNTEGFDGGFAALLVASLMAGYVLVGFDSAGELSEETRNPRKVAPRTILRALIVSGIGGALILLGALMATPSFGDDVSSGGLAYIVTARLGDTWGRVFLIDVVIAAFVCTLAIQTATTRMIYSMSRDQVLPMSKYLGRVTKRGGATAVAAVVTGVLAAALLAINLGHAGVFTALTSVCIVLLYLAYLGVTVPMLVQRLRGWGRQFDGQVDETGKPLFSLGRWGLPVNILAVLWGIAMMVNLAWPRADVYDPAGESPVLQYFAIIFVGITALAGVIAFLFKRNAYRAAIGHLPRNAAVDPAEVADASAAAGAVPTAEQTSAEQTAKASV